MWDTACQCIISEQSATALELTSNKYMCGCVCYRQCTETETANLECHHLGCSTLIRFDLVVPSSAAGGQVYVVQAKYLCVYAPSIIQAVPNTVNLGDVRGYNTVSTTPSASFRVIFSHQPGGAASRSAWPPNLELFAHCNFF